MEPQVRRVTCEAAPGLFWAKKEKEAIQSFFSRGKKIH